MSDKNDNQTPEVNEPKANEIQMTGGNLGDNIQPIKTDSLNDNKKDGDEPLELPRPEKDMMSAYLEQSESTMLQAEDIDDDNDEQNEEEIHHHVPSAEHSAEYESYFTSLDEYDEANPQGNRINSHTDAAAKRLSELQAIESTVRENARLTESIKSTRKQVLISMLVNMALTLLVLGMLFAFAIYPKTTYIATKDNTAICEVKPEDNPALTDIAISDFAKEGVLSLYTMDYINNSDQVEAALSKYFTARGRVDTVAAMRESGIIETVNTKALTLRAALESSPRIEQTGIGNNGKQYWVVRFPIRIDIYSGSPTPQTNQRHMVTVRVVANPASAANPKGLGISSIILASN